MDIRPGKCGECEKPLEKVYKDDRQLLNAMDLSLSPGYGEMFDGIHPLRFHLCEACAIKFTQQFPNLTEMIQKGCAIQMEGEI